MSATFANAARTLVVTLAMFAVPATGAVAADWPQFRGPGGNGVSKDSAKLPADIGPEKNVLWKTPLGKGHSSPVVFGGRVYLTEFKNRKLFTVALNAETGKVEWRRESPHKKLERFHRIGNPATPSTVTDGSVVVSFFGSTGLSAYSPNGKLLWHKPMGPFNNQFGATSSPILAGDRVVSIQDHDTGSYLAAFDKKTGKQIWRVERPNMRRNYCSPVVWTVNDRPQVVIGGTAHLMGYDLATGKLLWTIRGLCRVISNTPVIGADGRLYVASSGGGWASAQPEFASLLKQADANKNKRLEKSELPNSPIKRFFTQFDRDADGSLDKTEYESVREIYSLSRTVAMAVKPGGQGDITKSHVAWEMTRGVPRNSSPLVFGGHVYMVKDGGVMTILDAGTGQSLRQQRLGGRGKYYSSPVCGDGKLYVLDDRGVLSVLTVGANPKQLAAAKFGEAVLATPAIANGRLYVRTATQLYCFGKNTPGR